MEYSVKTVTIKKFILELSEEELKHIFGCVGTRSQADANAHGIKVNTTELYRGLQKALGDNVEISYL